MVHSGPTDDRQVLQAEASQVLTSEKQVAPELNTPLNKLESIKNFRANHLFVLIIKCNTNCRSSIHIEADSPGFEGAHVIWPSP